MHHLKPFSIIIFTSIIFPIFCSNDTQPTTLIQSSQTHVIPNGRYFQYTFTNMKLEEPLYNTTISECTLFCYICIDVINFSLDFSPIFLGSPILYNLLVFPQSNPNSEPLYQNFVKAAVQGLPGLMPIFPINITDPTGSCHQCYQTAIYATQPMACLKCNSSSIRINSTSQVWANSAKNLWNNTIMTVIDNSLVVGPTGGQVTLTMGYEINILYEQEFQALFILFLSVVCALIIILAILAVFITMRINKVEEEITEHKSKTKSE